MPCDERVAIRMSLSFLQPCCDQESMRLAILALVGCAILTLQKHLWESRAALRVKSHKRKPSPQRTLSKRGAEIDEVNKRHDPLETILIQKYLWAFRNGLRVG